MLHVSKMHDEWLTANITVTDHIILNDYIQVSVTKDNSIQTSDNGSNHIYTQSKMYQVNIQQVSSTLFCFPGIWDQKTHQNDTGHSVSPKLVTLLIGPCWTGMVWWISFSCFGLIVRFVCAAQAHANRWWFYNCGLHLCCIGCLLELLIF